MQTLRKHLRLASAFALCLFLSATVTPAAASGLVGSIAAANADFGLAEGETGDLGMLAAVLVATTESAVYVQMVFLEGEPKPSPAPTPEEIAHHAAMDFSSFDL